MSEITEKSKSPAVSVIIPLYNKGKYIGRAIESVLGQSYQDFEIIVVDDGSTDDGPAIVRGYADKRIKPIRQTNAGPGAARNRAIEESSAELVGFLDADDEWTSEFLAKGIEMLNAQADCAMVIASYYMGEQRVNMTGQMRERGLGKGSWQINERITAGELRRTVDAFNTSMVLARKEIVQRYGGFYWKDHCTYGEDTYLWLQIFLNHKIYGLSEPLVWFHTEASELWFGRKDILPLKAVLTDPEKLYENCPAKYVKILDGCLSRYALTAACLRAGHGKGKCARKLLRQFPTREFFSRYYLKRRLYIALAPLLRWWSRNCSEARVTDKSR